MNESYEQVVREMMTNPKMNKSVRPWPNIWYSIENLQLLADMYEQRFTWVIPCKVKLVPGLGRDERFSIWYGSLPLAQNVMEAEDDGTIVESEIQIGHKQFQTAGIVIHELAHMYKPYDNHGKEFTKAHGWLIQFWNNLMRQLK